MIGPKGMCNSDGHLVEPKNHFIVINTVYRVSIMHGLPNKHWVCHELREKNPVIWQAFASQILFFP